MRARAKSSNYFMYEITKKLKIKTAERRKDTRKIITDEDFPADDIPVVTIKVRMI